MKVNRERWRHLVGESIRRDKGKGNTPTSSALRSAQSPRLNLSLSTSVWHPLRESVDQSLILTHMESLSCVSSVGESMATAVWMVYSGWSPLNRLPLRSYASPNILYKWLDFIPGEKQNSCCLNPLNLFHFCSGVQNKLFSYWVMIAATPLMFWCNKNMASLRGLFVQCLLKVDHAITVQRNCTDV